MKTIEIIQTIYPRLPEIVDEASLAEIATLESKELEYVKIHESERYQYLKALYLKAILVLGHSRFKPGDVPRQLRLRIAQEVGVPKTLADIRTINPGEKSRIIAQVREVMGVFTQNRKISQCTL